jgi:hypothetical protein
LPLLSLPNPVQVPSFQRAKAQVNTPRTPVCVVRLFLNQG